MKNPLLLLLAASSYLHATTILIDFGPATTNSSNGTGPTTGLPQTWNNFAAADTSRGLSDTTGADTGYTLSSSGSFSNLNELPSPPSGPYPSTAGGDAIFSPASRILKLSGLDTSLVYSITAYGFISRADSRNTTVTIGGVPQSYEPSNLWTSGSNGAPVGALNPNGGSVTFSNLSPNGSGEIAITLSLGPGNTAGGVTSSSG
jgi:hypothetical protein